MKSIKYLTAVFALLTVFTLAAQADISSLGAEPFTGGPGGNSPEQDFNVLNTHLGGTLGDFSNFTVTELSVTGDVDLMAGCFLVLHFGTGNNGSNPGGGLEFFLVTADQTQTLPQFGTSEFGNGGLSSAREFCPTGGNQVPDSGTTAMLLGSALTGLGVIRRYLKR